MLCFRKFLVAKNFLDKKVGVGLTKLFVESYLSHSPETFRRGTILYCVSEKFWWRKRLCKRRGRGVSKYSVEKFLSHSAETFR